MKRERALLLTQHVIGALDANQHEWPLSLVTELYVFGSFARAPSTRVMSISMSNSVQMSAGVAASRLPLLRP